MIVSTPTGRRLIALPPAGYVIMEKIRSGSIRPRRGNSSLRHDPDAPSPPTGRTRRRAEDVSGSGRRVHGFFPPEGEQQAHKRGYSIARPTWPPMRGCSLMVKDSLGNALRIIRPVVVLDEGHRAISDLAFQHALRLQPLVSCWS